MSDRRSFVRFESFEEICTKYVLQNEKSIKNQSKKLRALLSTNYRSLFTN